MAEYLGTVEFGALYHKGTPLPRPTRPWQPSLDLFELGIGNIPKKEGNISNYILGNTPSDNNKKLKWHKIKDKNKIIFICDRNILVKVSWDDLNSQGYVFGKNISIDGIEYKMRILSGGNKFRGVGADSSYSGTYPLNNEWDRIIVNEDNILGLPQSTNTDLDSNSTKEDLTGVHNQKWNWFYCYSWCQEKYENYPVTYSLRGYNTPRYCSLPNSSLLGEYIGWRPVLEVLNTAPVISGTDTDLGTITKEPSYSYTVSDSDNDSVTVTEKLDGKTLRTLTSGEILGGGHYITPMTNG